MSIFSESLQELLDEKNLNRLGLAKLLGISSTTVNGYFNKDYYPQIDIAIKIADYFCCSLDYLFGLSDDKRNIFLKRDLNSFIIKFDKLLKQNKLAISTAMREMKMGEYNYYRWKKGMFPKTINLITIAKYFDTSTDYLVGKTDER